MKRRRLCIQDYTVGWVCALPIELAAATKMLDEEHQDLPRDDNDTNLYTLGRIGEHNVVIACLPAGQTGPSSAAAVVGEMKSKFAQIRFGLMVGIGGGVPTANSDIRLGDVVISQPHMQHGGVVQYDFGKAELSGFTRTGFLNTPPAILLNALSKLRANHHIGRNNILTHLSVFDHLPEFAYNNAGPDILFESTYKHVEGSACTQCSKDRLVERTQRASQEIVVHYGTIASGNQVIKDGLTRDMMSSELGGVMCFEMEAAGLMNNFPCLVIRGICDYADSHKNKTWQHYAAATAAACAKEILSIIPPAEVIKVRPVNTLSQTPHTRITDIDQMPQRLTDELKAAVEQESQLTRQEIYALRDLLMRNLTGHTSTSDLDALPIVRMHENDKREMARIVREQLFQFPRDLKDATQNVTAISNSRQRKTGPRGDAGRFGCYCFQYCQTSILRRGAFSLSSKSNSDHRPGCQYYKANKQSWTYGLAVQLLPYLNKTLEITLTARIGAGGASIAPTLRFYGTVNRSGSPIFQLFDEFYQTCREVVPEDKGRFRTLPQRQRIPLYFSADDSFVHDWNLEKVGTFMSTFERRLAALFAGSPAAVSEKDEDGVSVFHEIVLLAVSLGSLFDRFITYFENLMALTSRYGADISASGRICFEVYGPSAYAYLTKAEIRRSMNSSGGIFPYEIFSIPSNFLMSTQNMLHENPGDTYPAIFRKQRTMSHYKPRTYAYIEILTDLANSTPQLNVAEMLIHILASQFENEREFLPINIFNLLAEYEIDGPRAPRFCEKEFQIWLSQQQSTLVDDFLHDPLHIAIGHRKLNEVKLLLERGHDPDGSPETSPCCPLELALGWCTGMELLIDFGANPFRAFKLVVTHSDVASMDLLMARDCPLFDLEEDQVEPPDFDDSVGLVASRKSDVLDALFVQALIDRRLRLASLALNHLSSEDRSRCNMKDDQILNVAAFDIYQLLIGKGVAVPKSCYPGKRRSVYCRRDFYDSIASEALFESLYRAGFRDVDEHIMGRDTPLLQYSRIFSTSSHDCSIVAWFLRKGASPKFSGQNEFPNILFYLAAGVRYIDKFLAEDNENFSNLVEYAVTLCDPLATDACACYCSSKGCLPIQKFWRCDSHAFGDDKRSVIYYPQLNEYLEYWIALNHLRETEAQTYYHEACRLEIFDRLGMAHTCCVNQHEPRTLRRIVISGNERRELQEEDAELYEQLELLIQIYRKYRQKFVGSAKAFWNSWWRRVDVILPDLLPEERCRRRHETIHRHYYRDRNRQKQTTCLQEEASEQCADAGLDFIEVIRQHFAEDLETERLLEITPAESDDNVTSTQESILSEASDPDQEYHCSGANNPRSKLDQLCFWAARTADEEHK